VFVDAPLQVCIERDVKGLYARALAGEIQHFTGISDPYEAPVSPQLTLPTHLERAEDSAGRMMAFLEEEGWLPGARSATDHGAKLRAGAR
jgi:adenylylsulfate kinase